MQFPKTVKAEYDIERQSGNEFCTKAMFKKSIFRIQFEKIDGVKPN